MVKSPCFAQGIKCRGALKSRVGVGREAKDDKGTKDLQVPFHFLGSDHQVGWPTHPGDRDEMVEQVHGGRGAASPSAQL